MNLSSNDAYVRVIAAAILLALAGVTTVEATNRFSRKVYFEQIT